MLWRSRRPVEGVDMKVNFILTADNQKAIADLKTKLAVPSLSDEIQEQLLPYLIEDLTQFTKDSMIRYYDINSGIVECLPGDELDSLPEKKPPTDSETQGPSDEAEAAFMMAKNEIADNNVGELVEVLSLVPEYTTSIFNIYKDYKTCKADNPKHVCVGLFLLAMSKELIPLAGTG